MEDFIDKDGLDDDNYQRVNNSKIDCEEKKKIKVGPEYILSTEEIERADKIIAEMHKLS